MTQQTKRDAPDEDRPHDDNARGADVSADDTADDAEDGTTGGDAEGAGSVEEREAVALDEDETWGSEN